jgi:3-dehydroquinate synthetase
MHESYFLEAKLKTVHGEAIAVGMILESLFHGET